MGIDKLLARYVHRRENQWFSRLLLCLQPSRCECRFPRRYTFVLRSGLGPSSCGQPCHRFGEQPNSDGREGTPPYFRGGFTGQDMAPFLSFDRPGVRAVVHPVYGPARYRITHGHCPFDGVPPPVTGKERGVIGQNAKPAPAADGDGDIPLAMCRNRHVAPGECVHIGI